MQLTGRSLVLNHELISNLVSFVRPNCVLSARPIRALFLSDGFFPHDGF